MISDPECHNSASLNDLLEVYDALYISVFPEEALDAVYAEVLRHERTSSLIIVENSSVKAPLEGYLTDLDESGASVCSSNPLCQPQSWDYENVLLIPIGSNSEQAVAFARRLYTGMKIRMLESLSRHDELMCFLQLVPHTVFRSVSMLYRSLSVAPSVLDEFATANFKLFNLGFWRTVTQESGMSATLIRGLGDSPKGQEVQRTLLGCVVACIRSDRDALKTEFDAFLEKSGVSDSYIEDVDKNSREVLAWLATYDPRREIQ